jgi:hypothetical protein
MAPAAMRAEATSNLDQNGGARPGGARGPVVLTQGAGSVLMGSTIADGLGKIRWGNSSVANAGAKKACVSEGAGAGSGAWTHPQWVWHAHGCTACWQHPWSCGVGALNADQGRAKTPSQHANSTRSALMLDS